MSALRGKCEPWGVGTGLAAGRVCSGSVTGCAGDEGGLGFALFAGGQAEAGRRSKEGKNGSGFHIM